MYGVDIKTTLWTPLLVEFKQLSLVHRNNNTSDENICVRYTISLSELIVFSVVARTVNCEMRNMSAWLYGRASFTRARLAIHILFGTKHSLLLLARGCKYISTMWHSLKLTLNSNKLTERIVSDRDSCRVRNVVLEQMNLILSQLHILIA